MLVRTSATLGGWVLVRRTVARFAAGAAMLTFALALPAVASSEILINEIDTTTPAVRHDDHREFIELFDGGAGNTDLSGLVLVLYETGLGNAVSAAYDLDGFSTDAAGYFVLGNAWVVNVSYSLATTNFIASLDGAVALYEGNATDFPRMKPATTAGLLDAVVYSSGVRIPPYPELRALMNPGQPVVFEDSAGNWTGHSLQRIPNGSGGGRNTGTFVPLAPTPGFANGPYTPVSRRGLRRGLLLHLHPVGNRRVVPRRYHQRPRGCLPGEHRLQGACDHRAVPLQRSGHDDRRRRGGKCRHLPQGGGADAVLEGFTVSNGIGLDRYEDGYRSGGGIYIENSSPTIASCLVTGNSASDGGGISLINASPSLSRVVVSGNEAQWYGGGISMYGFCAPSCSLPVLRNVLVSGNAGRYGGESASGSTLT